MVKLSKSRKKVEQPMYAIKVEQQGARGSYCYIDTLYPFFGAAIWSHGKAGGPFP